jgi:hypothetical protein
VRGIGKVWRENPSVRTRLGWAYEPEYAFTGRRQEPGTQSGTYSDLYIDHGTRGLVLHLRRHSGADPLRSWRVAGTYDD